MDKRIALGTVGYHNLGNHSIGPLLYPALVAAPWARRIEVMEMNWGPIAIVQDFQSRPQPFDRVVLLSAIERPNRTVGDCTVFRWQGGVPDDEKIQDCIGDAVTGVISVQNLLAIGQHFGIWPEEVYLVDIEPGPERAGMSLTKNVNARIDEYLGIVEYLCTRELIRDVGTVPLNSANLFDTHVMTDND